MYVCISTGWNNKYRVMIMMRLATYLSDKLLDV